MKSAEGIYMNNGIKDKISIMRCPNCKGGISIVNDNSLECHSCKQNYYYSNNIIKMVPSVSDENIAKFWDADLSRRFQGVHISNDKMDEMYRSFEEALKDKEHLITREISLHDLDNKKILEIGCGSGAHSALMKRYNADIIAMDISEKRVEAAAAKIASVKQGAGIAMHGDATILPFQDEQFDIVYSNGVLHHSADTAASIKEIYRVLRPGGTAAVMLYARRSVSTYLYRYPKGILSGLYFKYPEEKWMGYVTEGGPCGDIANPYTKVYTQEQVRTLFSEFREIAIRQSSFSLKDIPKIGKHIYSILKKINALKDFEGTLLTSGVPMPQLAPIEKKLGKYLGNCLNILAVK